MNMATHSPSRGLEADMAHSPVTSQVLENRLHARRINSKTKRRRTDIGIVRHDNEDDPFMAEAEASFLRASTADAELGAPSKNNTPKKTQDTRTHGTGLKEMDERLQKLEKLNFDLKMEVFHRREREHKLLDQMKAMYVHVRKADKLREEYATIKHINRELSSELENANEAVDQAVEMICNLEAEVETLKDANMARLPSVHSDSGYATSITPLTSSLPSFERSRHSKAPAKLQTAATPIGHKKPNTRVPSFMSNNDEATQALREAYSGKARSLHTAMSFMSVASGDETHNGKPDDLDSPPLSALSESSFPSLYPTKVDLDRTKVSAADVLRSSQNAKSTEWDPHAKHEHSFRRVTDWVCQGQDFTDIFVDASSKGRADTAVTSRNLLSHEDEVGSSRDPFTNDSRPTSSDRDQNPGTPYPDGGSIVTGTPSRFRKQANAELTSDAYHEEEHGTPRRDYYSHTADIGHDSMRDTPRALSTIAQSPAPDWPLRSSPRRDSANMPPLTLPKEVEPRRKSKRNSLAARTQKLFGFGRTNDGPPAPTVIPPKPNMSLRRPLVKSATTADVTLRVPQTGPARSDSVGLLEKAGSRRESVDPTSFQQTDRQDADVSRVARSLTSRVRHQTTHSLSQDGAKAAWGVRGRRGSATEHRVGGWRV